MYRKWIHILMKVELFKNIPEDELYTVLSCVMPTISSYKKKELITLEQSEITAIGIILKGEAVITKETMAGDRVIMAKINKGNMFGEVAAFANHKWPATVVADTDCVILFFPSDKIIGVCPKACLAHRVLIQNMLQIVSQKALMLNQKIEMLSLKSIRKKISTYLLKQYSMKGSLLFEIPLKRNELAEYLLVSRPSLSRELIKMKGEGILDFHRNSFKILNLDGLKECL
ncbi:Crp/Fnr family transcriptional regulator [Inediibacterium massiliense]|uniref:Crp/Fnr family transcriptional regulator n=1 Tax=Inediibacterium massiliense TaxID=1658111 RepID=UPI0006B4AE70|nr:Crp/Fnr family transcriptional regulator [Inediibacterium massiliense]